MLIFKKANGKTAPERLIAIETLLTTFIEDQNKHHDELKASFSKQHRENENSIKGLEKQISLLCTKHEEIALSHVKVDGQVRTHKDDINKLQLDCTAQNEKCDNRYFDVKREIDAKYKQVETIISNDIYNMRVEVKEIFEKYEQKLKENKNRNLKIWIAIGIVSFSTFGIIVAPYISKLIKICVQ